MAANFKKTDKDRDSAKQSLSERDFLEKSFSLICSFNVRKRKIEYVNSASTQIVGISPTQMNRMGLDSFLLKVHPGDLEKLDNFSKIFEKDSQSSVLSNSVEFRFNKDRDKYNWLNMKWSTILGDDNQPQSVVCTINDIADYKNKIEKVKSNYKHLHKNAKIALFKTRINDGKVLHCNQKLAEILGYKTAQHCIDQHFITQSYYKPSSREELLNILREQKYVEDFEVEIVKSDGSNAWVKMWARMDQQKGHIEGGLRDITVAKLLSKTERKVLKFLVKGLNNKDVATKMDRSVRTIEDHRFNIMKKLNVSNSMELAEKVLDIDLD